MGLQFADLVGFVVQLPLQLPKLQLQFEVVVGGLSGFGGVVATLQLEFGFGLAQLGLEFAAALVEECLQPPNLASTLLPLPLQLPSASLNLLPQPLHFPLTTPQLPLQLPNLIIEFPCALLPSLLTLRLKFLNEAAAAAAAAPEDPAHLISASF